jgi:deoxyadenosine/deoxycytidine kinase
MKINESDIQLCIEELKQNIVRRNNKFSSEIHKSNAESFAHIYEEMVELQQAIHANSEVNTTNEMMDCAVVSIIAWISNNIRKNKNKKEGKV